MARAARPLHSIGHEKERGARLPRIVTPKTRHDGNGPSRRTEGEKQKTPKTELKDWPADTVLMVKLRMEHYRNKRTLSRCGGSGPMREPDHKPNFHAAGDMVTGWTGSAMR
jgi:hypothetical protein